MNIADELFDIWSAKPANKSLVKANKSEKSKRFSRALKSEDKTEKSKPVEKSEEYYSLLAQFLDAEKPLKSKKKSFDVCSPSAFVAAQAPNDKNFMAAIKSIQKNAEKIGISKESGTFCKDGTLYIHDSHRIVKSKYDFIGAEENPKGFDAERFFETFKSSNKISSPSFEELSEMVKKTRREAGKRKPTRVLYQFKNGLTVNADYLLDAMAITGTSEFYCSDNKSPLIFKSEDDFYEVVVCPVNPAEKFQGCRIA